MNVTTGPINLRTDGRLFQEQSQYFGSNCLSGSFALRQASLSRNGSTGVNERMERYCYV
jgi:hypothetical protein